jgi:hypothetical protein
MGDDDASPTCSHPRRIAVKEVVFPITDSSDIKENCQKEDFGRSVTEGEDKRQKGTGIIIATKENADPSGEDDESPITIHGDHGRGELSKFNKDDHVTYILQQPSIVPQQRDDTHTHYVSI